MDFVSIVYEYQNEQYVVLLDGGLVASGFRNRSLAEAFCSQEGYIFYED